MLKSTLVCFSLLGVFGEVVSTKTCIPLATSEYATWDSEGELKGLKDVQKIYFKPQPTISTEEEFNIAPTPTKPILIIKATHE